MRTSGSIVATLIIASSLAACGQDTVRTSASPTGNSATSTTTSPTTTTTTPPPPSPPTSTQPRILQKRFGELAGVGSSCQSTVETCDIVFTITKITNCTGRYAGDPPPEGTVRKLVWLQVTTGPNYSTTEIPSGLITQFTAISTTGVTSGNINPSTWWKCAPENDQMGYGDENWLPGKKYAGAVEVYLPKDAAKISNGDGVWEWTLP